MTAQPADRNPASGPDTGSYEVIPLAGQAVVVVPVSDFLRLQALEQAAGPQELEDAEDKAALADWRAREAAGQTSYVPHDEVLLADYASPGRVLVMDHFGHVLWSYGPTSGPGRLDHPSLALELPNGDIAVNDDYRNRVVIIDPRQGRIVWQYGHTDKSGTGPGYLTTPDGMDFIPAGPRGQIDWSAVVHP